VESYRYEPPYTTLSHRRRNLVGTLVITNEEGLSIGARVGLLRAGLLSETDVRILIFDAMAQNMLHYLPREMREYGAAMLKTGKIILPES
jgi:hypothetical protein